MIDVSQLLERYQEQLSAASNAEHCLAEFVRELVDLRHCIIDQESPRCDDAVTRGVRFFRGLVKYAYAANEDSGVQIVDPTRGVISVCGLPVKIYRPDNAGRPRANKTLVESRERDAIEILALPGFESQFTNLLVRLEDDEDGAPEAIRWEEWEHDRLIWSVRIFERSGTPTLRLVDPDTLPEPAKPNKPRITEDDQKPIERGDGDDDTTDD